MESKGIPLYLGDIELSSNRIKSKNCKTCKIELTSDNAYSRSKTVFKPYGYCRECDKKRRINIQEELGISEEGNIDPNYMPCCHVKVNPPKAVRINPGSTVNFGDISDFNESQATVCDYCGMCQSSGRCARGATTDETSVCTGDVQVTLTWHAEADIDLYVEDPNGAKVSYGNPSVSSGGQLDRDNKCGDFVMGRPENICWPKNVAPEGTYKVSVNYYADCADAGPVSWTVRTVVRGQAKTYRGTLNEVKETQEVTTFEV